MPQRGLLAVVFVILLAMSIIPVAAQEPTTEPYYDPCCAMDMTRAYLSGWEYDHRDGSVLDMIQAAQVARAVYNAFRPLKIDCQFANGNLRQSVLRSMHGDYPPEELARMLSYLQEVVGAVDYGDCSYALADQFIGRVEWGDSTALQVGRTIGDIYRTVRDTVPSGECDGTFKLITNILSQLDEIPPDSTLISGLYTTLTTVTDGLSISEYSCGYELADTFFDKVDWEGLTSAQINQLVEDTFRVTYGISGDRSCDEYSSLAITAMLLNDVYQLAPDPSIIQQTFDAADGKTVPATATPVS